VTPRGITFSRRSVINQPLLLAGENLQARSPSVPFMGRCGQVDASAPVEVPDALYAISR
jgi:hypothetical protein